MKINKVDNEIHIIRHVTMVGFWINAFLIVLKLFFGYWGHSDALVADGYHSVSDFATDFMVLFFIGIAYKKADSDHPYGHGKFETIASLFIAIILFMVAVGIGWGGIAVIVGFLNGKAILRPDVWTIAIALLSILLKEFCFRYTDRYARSLGSSALKANAWHHRSDAISSVATLVGVTLSYSLGEKWHILDPIASIIISIFIALSALEIARPNINELLEKSVPASDLNKIRQIIKSVSGVKYEHNLRARRNGKALIVDVNIHVDPDLTIRAGHAIATNVEDRLRKKTGEDCIVYVHVEPDESE